MIKPTRNTLKVMAALILALVCAGLILQPTGWVTAFLVIAGRVLAFGSTFLLLRLVLQILEEEP